MFPNIDNALGLRAVKEALEGRVVCKPSTGCILEAVEICLNHNNSTFNDSHYLQIHGTAMGPKNACSYADIAMSYIDKIATTQGPYAPNNWWRFRDDIFEIWTHGVEALESFTNFINSIYPSIEFVVRSSESKLEFLDVLVHLHEGEIYTDVYSKPTDGHLYLRTDSAHPSSCKRSIPYSIALRLKRICSKPELLESRLAEYKQYLVQRGYKENFVQAQFQKVKLISRTQLLQNPNGSKTKASQRKYPLILDYHPGLRHLSNVLRDSFHLLYSSPMMKDIFPEKSIFSRLPKV